MGRRIKIKKSKVKMVPINSIHSVPGGRWSKLPEHWVPYVKEVHEACNEFFPQTYEECEANFKHDLHPNQELLIWVVMARVLQETFKRFELTGTGTRKVVYTILLDYMSGGDPHKIASYYASSPLQVQTEFTREMFKEMFQIYKKEPSPPILFSDVDFQDYIGDPEDLKYI